MYHAIYVTEIVDFIDKCLNTNISIDTKEKGIDVECCNLFVNNLVVYERC